MNDCEIEIGEYKAKKFKVGDHVMIPRFTRGFPYIAEFELTQIIRESKKYWYTANRQFRKDEQAFYVKPCFEHRRLSDKEYFIQFDHDHYRLQIDKASAWMQCNFLNHYDFKQLGHENVSKLYDIVKAMDA